MNNLILALANQIECELKEEIKFIPIEPKYTEENKVQLEAYIQQLPHIIKEHIITNTELDNSL
jgi:hypothetical protein